MPVSKERTLQNRPFRYVATAAALTLAAPAHAAGGSFVLPEPDMVTLLSLAIAGVMIGRRMSNRRPPE